MENNTKDKIDLVAITKTLWKNKRLFGLSCGVAFVIGAVVAFSIPKTYQTKVILAPEVSSGSSMSESLSDIASMMGVNLGKGGSSVDAIYPEIYPQIIKSTPFLTSMFNVKVTSLDGKVKEMPLYNYLLSHQKMPWWDSILQGIIGIFSSKGIAGAEVKVNNFHLTEEQEGILHQVENMITCNVDKKTNIITISVTAQDALISASLADTVQTKMQQYVTNYRTKKARNDLAYSQKLFSEAKAQYIKAQQMFGHYSDANTDLILQSFKAKQDELENEMQLRYNIYNQTSQQMQMARAKVQERTPAFTQIQPATVPLKKDGPKRMTIVLAFMFFAFVLTSIHVLIQDAKKNNA